MLKPQLLKLLSNLPNTQKVQQRKAFLMFIGFDQLASKIDLEGDNFSFFAGLIEVLTLEGQASLLEFIDNLIESPWSGLDSGERLKSLRSRIAELEAGQWRREFFGEVDNGHSLQHPPQNIPRSGTAKFVGRSKELETLHNYLQRPGVDVTIVGMGGVGKTELAIQYAQQYWQEFYPGGVCWLRARASNVGAQIVEFVQLYMGLSAPQTLMGLKLDQQVKWCWQNWQPPRLPILVVIDDVTDYEGIQPYLPPANLRFKVLITTRIRWLVQSFVELYLDILHESAAIDLLKTFLGTERLEQEFLIAKELCNWLGYLPLGLDLVGRYLQRKRDLLLEDLLNQRLEKERLDQQSLQKPKPDMTAQLGMEETFKLTWQELDTQAQQLGCLLSLFTLAPIPWSLVELCFPDQDLKNLEDIRDDSLFNLNLLQRTGKNTYQLHQVVREFLKGQLEQSDWANNFICL